jgi:hypothetical protein
MPDESPPRRRIVVDGSNIATEGRTLPSLAQLDEAIRTFLEEFGGFSSADVTVVVDASFGHRIDESERAAFEEAVLHGEMVTPPAGAHGRGDGFILRIAEKSGALVLSNDSFQEFHAERPWLFDDGRLIGGKPVPGVGWVFTPRTPVRGPKSRSVTSRSRRDARVNDAIDEVGELGTGVEVATAATTTRAARSTKAVKSAEPTKAAKATKATTKTTTRATKSTKAAKSAEPTKATKSTKATTRATKSTKAVKSAEPTKAAKATKATKTAKAAKAAKAGATAKTGGKTTKAAASEVRRAPTPDPSGSAGPALNDPLTFLTFVANYPIGSRFDGTVVSFTSHGAHVDVGAMRCHIPLGGLADPAPQKARDVLTKGETRQFELVSLDAARRRAALTLPGIGS